MNTKIISPKTMLRLEAMKCRNPDTTFAKLEGNAPRPYELLLLADPSKDLVDGYLRQSDIFVAAAQEETLGVVVLLPLTEDTVEIKNVAVRPEFQGRGIGTYLIEQAVRVATLEKYKSICIGTADSSAGQLYLYQKLGFEITGVKKDFFIENYADPVFENGIQARHMLVLTRRL